MSHKLRHEAIRRPLVDIPRRTDLLQSPLADDGQLFRQQHGFFLVVGDVDHRGLELPLQAHQFAPHQQPRACVQVAERLIQQQHIGFSHERASQGDPLPLAPRQLVGTAPQQLRHVEHFRRTANAAVDNVAGGFAQFERKGQVRVHIHVGVQGEMLGHHRHVALPRRQAVHAASANANRSARRLLQTSDQSQRRRLAAARWPHHHQARLIGNVQAEVVHGENLAELLRQA